MMIKKHLWIKLQIGKQGKQDTPYGITRDQLVNSLAPGKFERNFNQLIFKMILVIDGWIT